MKTATNETMKYKCIKQLGEVVSEKYCNNVFLEHEKYCNLIDRLNVLKIVRKKIPSDYRLFAKYDVIRVVGMENSRENAIISLMSESQYFVEITNIYEAE